MADAITPETFIDHVNKTFRVICVEGTLEVELVEMTVHQDPGIEGLRQPFTLIFRGPKDPILSEGLHRVENDDAGSLELYIIPIMSPPDRQDYQVVFN